MFKFIADSACDLKEFPGVPFETVPLTLSTDDRNFIDDTNLNVHEVIDFFQSHNGKSYTSCPSMQAWLDAFEGYDEIYVVTITSGLSGTYNGANTAKVQFLSKHPAAKICIVDSLMTGSGEIMLLEKLAELKKLGKTFEEISCEIITYRDSLRLFFGLRSLHNLAANGRVNKIVASAIGIMNIRILGTASKAGTIDPIAKCRGDKKVLETMIAEMKKAGFKGGKVRICHVENEELTKEIVDALKKEFGDIDISYVPTRGLCSYYAERGGIILGCEC